MKYAAEWNQDLDGYVITFSDGKIAHTQINVNDNRLHADYGCKLLERYEEYDSDLSEEQHIAVNEFVFEQNKED